MLSLIPLNKFTYWIQSISILDFKLKNCNIKIFFYCVYFFNILLWKYLLWFISRKGKWKYLNCPGIKFHCLKMLTKKNWEEKWEKFVVVWEKMLHFERANRFVVVREIFSRSQHNSMRVALCWGMHWIFIKTHFQPEIFSKNQISSGKS